MKIKDYIFEEYIDFEIINESWNIYALEDKSVLKFKLLLLKVIPIPTTDATVDTTADYALNTRIVFASLVPKELKGTPSTPNQPNVQSNIEIEQKDIPFKIIEESWNEYKLENGTILKVKPAITRIDRLKIYDKYGEPQYSIMNQILIKV
jgi:hypothetical protein